MSQHRPLWQCCDKDTIFCRVCVEIMQIFCFFMIFAERRGVRSVAARSVFSSTRCMAYPMVTRVVPSMTLSPAATQMPVMVPSASAVMLFSIFMASSTSTVSPFLTA